MAGATVILCSDFDTKIILRVKNSLEMSPSEESLGNGAQTRSMATQCESTNDVAEPEPQTAHPNSPRDRTTKIVVRRPKTVLAMGILERIW